MCKTRRAREESNIYGITTLSGRNGKKEKTIQNGGKGRSGKGISAKKQKTLQNG
jgi:hypothetical protein